MAGRVRLRNQIIDRASQSATIASSSKGTLSVAGAVFPLLAGTAFRIYNIGGNVYDADNSLLVAVNDIYLYALFFSDPEGKDPITDPNGFFAQLVLAGAGWGSGAFLGGNGFSVNQQGDPLVEFRANSLVIGLPDTPRSVQIQANADVNNTDAVNGHVVNFQYSALVAQEPETY